MQGNLPPLIIDVGSCWTKAGFAGQHQFPRVVFPTVVGRSFSRGNNTNNNRSPPQRQEATLYVGDEAVQRSMMLDLSFPVEYGVVRKWDDWEAVIGEVGMKMRQSSSSAIRRLIARRAG